MNREQRDPAETWLVRGKVAGGAEGIGFWKVGGGKVGRGGCSWQGLARPSPEWMGHQVGGSWKMKVTGFP